MENMPLIWIGVMIVMLILEAVSAQLVSVWFVVGALAAAVSSFFTPSIPVQFCVFIVVSLVLLAATRPLVKKLRSNTKMTPTNADRYIGQTAVVIEDIDDVTGKGQVKVAGSVWSAKSSDGGVIEKGSDVTVREIKGVKLIVERRA